MSVVIPKTSEVSKVIIDQLQASFNQRIPLLPKAFNRVLAKIFAGVFVLLYKYCGFIFLNMFVRFATNDETEINGKVVRPLTEWGRLIGVGDPVSGVRAEYVGRVTVTNQTGNLPASSQALGADNGVTYLSIGAVPLDAATKDVDFRASADQAGGDGSGSVGNLEIGATISFANPLPNVASDIEIISQTTAGADGETTEEYRQRIIDRFQKRPQGGAPSDYEIWGEETAGIINTYPYKSDPGEVDLYSEATPESSGSADGIPTAAQLEAVLDSVELDQGGLASRRSLNAYVNSLPITRTPFTVEITGLVADNLTKTQEVMTEAVEQYFTDREPFISGLSIEPRKDRVVQSEVAGAVANVASAFGAVFVSVIVKQASLVIQLYQTGKGEKTKASAVTFP